MKLSESTKELLEKLQQTMEDIKAILLLANQDQLEAAKKNLLKSGSLEQQVYDLCDGENTNQTIANELNKPEKNIRAAISNLRQKGLIKNVEKNNQKFYEQIL